MNVATDYSSLQVYSLDFLTFWEDCHFLIPFCSSPENWIMDFCPRGPVLIMSTLLLTELWMILRFGKSTEKRGESVDFLGSLGAWYLCVHALMRQNEWQGSQCVYFRADLRSSTTAETNHPLVQIQPSWRILYSL